MYCPISVGHVPMYIQLRSIGGTKNRIKKIMVLLLDQFFFCDPVVLESICHSTRAKRLINEGNTTGGLRKIWTGTNDLHQPSCNRSSVVGSTVNVMHAVEDKRR